MIYDVDSTILLRILAQVKYEKSEATMYVVCVRDS